MVKKKGERYKCEDCGLVILVEDPCGCESCEIVCCGEPMSKHKRNSNQIKPNNKQLNYFLLYFFNSYIYFTLLN